MRLLFRFFGFLFALGTLVFIVGVGAISGLIYHYNKDLPDYSQLQDYEPPVMTRVHAADGELLAEYAKQRRLYLPIQADPQARPQRLHLGRGQELLRASRARFRRHLPRRHGLCAERRQGTPPAGRFHHHPAGGQELPPDQRGVVRPQDQGSAARAQDRAHLQQGAHPRALSERDLSRLQRLWRRRRLAALLRQVGERAHGRRGGLSRRAPQGAERPAPVPQPRPRRSSGATT